MFPKSFASLEDAARYTLRAHYYVHLLFPTRSEDGVNLAARMMAENILPLAEREALKNEAEQRIHSERCKLALELIYD